jgi:hypothetical protein
MKKLHLIRPATSKIAYCNTLDCADNRDPFMIFNETFDFSFDPYEIAVRRRTKCLSFKIAMT